MRDEKRKEMEQIKNWILIDLNIFYYVIEYQRKSGACMNVYQFHVGIIFINILLCHMKNNSEANGQSAQQLQNKFEGESTSAVLDPLWKRVNPKISNDEDDLVQISPDPMSKQQNEDVENDVVVNLRKNSNINQFFWKLHNQVNDSMSQSGSQIMEKLSLDWDEEQGLRANPSSLVNTYSISQSNISVFHGSKFDERNSNCQQNLKQINCLKQFLPFINKLNNKLFQQITQLLLQNQKLNQQSTIIKDKQKKISIKINLLNQQIHTLQKKNNKLAIDCQKLKKSMEVHIQLEAEKYKYKYEKIMKTMKEDFQRKNYQAQKWIQTSTNFTNSTTNLTNLTNNSNLHETMAIDTTYQHSANKLRAVESTLTPVNKKKALGRPHKPYSFKEASNDKELNCETFQSKGAIKPKRKIQQNIFDQLLRQIVKPAATKSLKYFQPK